MLPVRDANPTSRPAVVTVVLALVCVVVFVMVQPRGDAFSQASFDLRRAAVPDEIATREPLTTLEVARTLQSAPAAVAMCGTDDPSRACFPDKGIGTSVLMSLFLHGGWLHLLGNVLFLWIFGNNVEDRLGRLAFLAFYVLAGVVATLGHVLADPTSTVPLVGASGAIAGVMGAYLVWFPRARITTLVFVVLVLPLRLQARWLLLGWFVLQFFTNPNSGVAWVAHVSGFAFGVVVAVVLRGRRAIGPGLPGPTGLTSP